MFLFCFISKVDASTRENQDDTELDDTEHEVSQSVDAVVNKIHVVSPDVGETVFESQGLC